MFFYPSNITGKNIDHRRTAKVNRVVVKNISWKLPKEPSSCKLSKTKYYEKEH